MNNRGGLVALLIFAVIFGGVFVALAMFGGKGDQVPAVPGANVVEASDSSEASQAEEPLPPIQQELNDLSSKMVAELRNEDRLSLNMVAQLRSYEEMLRHIESYAKKIERDIDIIEEISKDEYQEDVKLQASLFAGKKSTLVAKHLEEFRASRVGAILAKMKEKEASAVLDVWAKGSDPKVSAFYREVVAAYLNNKRRDANPELFNKLVQDNQDQAPAESSS